MSAMPAKAYAAITNLVAQIIRHHTGGNDVRQPAYMVARAALLHLRAALLHLRAALLHLRAAHGPKAAAETAYQLADEIAVGDQ